MPARKTTKRKSPKKKQEQTEQHQEGLLAFVADGHIGNHRHGATATKYGGVNSRCLLAIQVHAHAIKVARERGAELMASGGDMMDQRRPEPAVLAATARMLERETQDLPFVAVPGNHEMLDAKADDGNTALEPFYPHCSVPRDPEWFVIEAMDAGVFCVPFEGRVTMEEHLRTQLAAQKEQPYNKKILVTHVGVFDDSSPHWLRGKDAIHKDMLFHAMEAGGFQAAFVGNFHENQQWKKDGRLIYQVGPLCPASFSDAGIFPKVGGLVLYDGEAVDLVEIPGPRFIKLKPSESLQSYVEQSAKGCTFFVRTSNSTQAEEMEANMGHEGLVMAEVMPPAPPTDPAKLPTADNAGEAIEAYVGSMDLPQGVKHTDVLTSAMDYWKKAGGEKQDET